MRLFILFLFVTVFAEAQPTRRVPYPILHNYELVIDASGLATNTNNAYGTVDGSNVITAIKSVTPSPTGRDFTVVGSGVTFDPTTKSIAFNGSGRLRSGSANSTWEFLNYDDTLNSLDYTIFMVAKVNSGVSNSGFLGTNGTASASIGMSMYYSNSSSSIIDRFIYGITRGTNTNFISSKVVNSAVPKDQYMVITVRVDQQNIAARAAQVWINGDSLNLPVNTRNNTSPQATPTYALEIGGCGNSIFPLTGNIKELIMVREPVEGARRTVIENALANKHNIVFSDDAYVNETTPFASVKFLPPTSTLYYFNASIGQNPTSLKDVVGVYTSGTAHVYNAAKKVVTRSSTNRGLSWSAESTVFDPSGAEAPQDGGGGFDNNGRFSYIFDTMTGTGPGQTHKVYQTYSDNNGSSWTTTDITASVASDGLLTWRMYGGIIVNDGVWMKPYYKMAEEGDLSSTAIYIFRSTDGTTWTSVQVKAPSATYINESWVVALDNSNLILVARNEATLEWQQYSSTDNGLTWSDDGALTFGETITSANPLCLKWFTHKGQRVIVAYYPDRNNDVWKAVYALPANLISSGVSGWDLDTKFVLWRSTNENRHLHYGDVSQIDGKFNAVGFYPLDPYPGSGSGVINDLIAFPVPSWQLSLIETELGL